MLNSQGRLLTPSILLGTIIWVTIVLTASAEPTNCVPVPPGLAGWWAGEGNAHDNLGGNNGALYGSVGFGAGKVGQAFNFDGSSGYVGIPASASLNVGVGAGFTFECWIKPAALADAQPVAEWNSGAYVGPQLWISPPPPSGGGSGSIYVNLIDTAGTSHTLTTGAGIVNTNGFQHVALSYDKASGMASLYYNGAMVAAGKLGSFTPQTSFGLYLGKHDSDAGAASFHGLMDEASLYNRALTATEIQAIYNAGAAGKCATGIPPFISAQPTGQTVPLAATVTFSAAAGGTPPLSFQWRFNGTNILAATTTALTLANVQLAQAGNYTVRVTNLYGSVTSSNAILTVNPAIACVPPFSGLVGWWRAEGNGLDSFGTNSAVLHNGVGFFSGKVGRAFSFNGTNSYAEVADSPSLRLTNELTIEFWVQRQSLQNEDYIINKGGDYTGGMLDYGVTITRAQSGNTLAFTFAGGARQSLTITDLNWHHCAVTARNGDVDPIFYVDGVQRAVTARTGSSTIKLYASTAALDIGAQIDPATGWSFYSGALIDELSLYSRALTAAEIQAIYNADGAGKCLLGTAPSITAQPASQTVLAGATATFSVVAAGSSPLSYQWRFNGTNLSGANGTALTLTNVQPAQAGTYTVQVTNLYGSATSSNAVLTVNPVLSCAPPPAGLVSWWAAEGNALDSVGTNNGVLFGAGFGDGMVGQAFSFDGATQAVFIPCSPSLLATIYSAEAWVKPLTQVSDPVNQEQIIGQAGGWQLVVRPGVSGVSVAFVFATSSGSFPGVVSTSELPLGQFSHVVGTWDGTTLRLYINGVLNAQKVAGATPVDSGRELHIGGSRDGSTPVQCFHGLIDEASYYNRALSGAEIQAIYNAGSAGKCPPGVGPSILTQPANQTLAGGATATFTVTAAGAPPLSYQWRFGGTNIAGATGTSLTLSNVQSAQAGSYAVRVTNTFGSIMSSNALLTVVPASTNCVPAPPGLVSWWTAEGNTLDRIGSNPGVAHNGVDFAGGEVGQAFVFIGSSNSYVEVADSPALRLTNALTVECWARRLNTSEKHALVEKGGDWTGGQTDFEMGLNDMYPGGSHLDFEFGGGGRSCAVPLDTAWHHYAAVAVNGQADPVLYIDGVAQNIIYRVGVAAVNLVASTRPLHIGAQVDSQTGWSYYSSTMIDELAVFNRALSASEIQAIYQAGSAGKCPPGVAPSIMTQPSSLTVTAGATATFSATAAGTPPLGYQWRFNGTNLAGATATSLALSNVQAAQAGNYSMRVTNTYGSTISSNALLTVISTPPCATPPAGLVSWWAAEGNALDSVGTNNGVLVNGAAFGSGEVGQAFSFDGATQGVTVPYSRSLAATNYSVEAWVKPLTQVSDPLNQEQIIGQAYGWQLVVQPGTSGIRVVFMFATSMTTFDTVVSTSELPIGQFSHVVGSWDGTTLRLHINGVLDAQRAPGTTPVDSGREVYIGGSQGAGYPTQCFHGLIDEVSYYSRALSGAEIQSLYKAGGAGKCPQGRQVLQLRLQVNLNPDGTTRVQFVGNNSQSYRIEESTDLVKWVSLGTCTADPEGNVEFSDPKVAKQPLRFYRAVEQ